MREIIRMAGESGVRGRLLEWQEKVESEGGC